jgi:cytoskeletal protein CcmA (bactofilin family)
VRSKKFKAAKISTVIGADTEITGDLVFSGGLHLDGTVKGSLKADPHGDSTLTLSEQGTIEGDVRVPNVVLNGVVVGDVYASKRVELAPKAKVQGTVYYNMLEMALGAEVNGQLVHTEEEEPRRLGYDGEPQPAAGVEEMG